MLNIFARTILTASSISPICLSVALLVGISSSNEKGIVEKTLQLWQHLLNLELSQKEGVFILSIGLFLLSTLPFCYVFKQAKRQAKLKHPSNAFTITQVTPAHKEMANYFISYLFPLMAGAEILSNLSVAIFFYVSVFIWISYSGAYTFNPILAFKGYKFYEAERSSNVNIILITHSTLLDINNTSLQVVRLTEHTYLQIEDT